jgi:NADPH2 dehydrogenase
MRMEDPVPTFSYVVKELAKRHTDLAYVHFVEPVVAGDSDQKLNQAHDTGSATVHIHLIHAMTKTDEFEQYPDSNDFARDIWSPRTFLSAGGYDPKSGEEAANKYGNAAIVFGRHFIANVSVFSRSPAIRILILACGQ